jgi:cardiolipin synthase A/B
MGAHTSWGLCLSPLSVLPRPLFVVFVATTAAACVAPLSPQLELRGAVPAPADGEAFDVALFQTVGARLVGGHKVRLEDDGRVFDAIVADIGRARTSVNFVSYIWHSGEPSDRIIAALGKRDPRVACRVLADPLGSPDFEKNVAPRLDAVRCEHHLFRPLSRHPLPERNHRKIVVVDGHIGFVGGFGVRQEWVKASGSSDPEWRDINVRIEGPAVADLQRAFAQNWQEAGGTLLPVDDFPHIEPAGEARVAFVSSSFGYVTNADRLTLLTIASARKRLWVWNAYFVPDDKLEERILDRAAHGVDVRVIAPGDKNDVLASKLGQRARYPTLRKGGVQLWEFQPTMMHAKTTIIDDHVAVIGSINYTSLSLTRLEEDAVVIDDAELTRALERDWADDIAKSRAVAD